ncbi:FAD dependent dehydrogenase, partial [Streptomyces misionensis]
LVVACALHPGDGAAARVRVAVRDGYDVLDTEVAAGGDPEETLRLLRATALDGLPAAAWAVVRPQVLGLLTGR